MKKLWISKFYLYFSLPIILFIIIFILKSEIPILKDNFRLQKLINNGTFNINNIDQIEIKYFLEKQNKKIKSKELYQYILEILNSKNEEGLPLPMRGDPNIGANFKIVSKDNIELNLHIIMNMKYKIIRVYRYYNQGCYDYTINDAKKNLSIKIIKLLEKETGKIL